MRHVSSLLMWTVVLAVLVNFICAQPSFPFEARVEGSNLILTLSTRSSNVQWLGVGFNANGDMFPSDAIVCQNGSTPGCTDRQCTALRECDIDSVQNITTQLTTTNGVTTFVVTRPLQTSDPTDFVVSATSPPRMIWGWAQGATSVQHSQRGSFTPSFGNTSGTGGTAGTDSSNAISDSLQLKSFITIVAIGMLSMLLV